MATAVMDSFKSSFLHALNSSPTAMCENCPLQQLHALCQNLEGVSTPVAQSRIQECLSQLSEADYNCIMSEYKSSEHADHEFTQLVVLVSLIREHLQKKQQEHIHPIHNVAGTSGTNHHQTLKPPRLSKLERAKLALTNSFDNLRKGSIRNSENRKRRFGKSMTMEENTGTAPLLTTENRRASLDPKELAKKRREKTELVRTLSAKVPVVRESGGGDSSGSEEGGRGGRSRSSSWLQRFRPSKPVSSSQEDVSDNEARKTDGEREPSPLTSSVMQEDPKKLKPAQKVENFESKEDLTSEPLPAHTQSSSTPTPVLSPNKSSPPPSVTPPPSTVPSSIFKTPTRTPMWRKPNMRAQRAHTRATFSPPPTEGSRAAVEKYRREHKRSESMSWRHEIFESVTPVKERNTEKHNSFQDWEIIEPASFDQLGGSTTIHCTAMGGEGEELRGRGSPRTVARERWRRAIEQQIMLQRMEKQNQTIIKASTEADTKRLKLCYKDPSIHVDNISRKWAELLSRPLPLEQSELRPILLEGITPARRGEVWSLLIQLYQDTHPSLPPSPPAPPSPLSFTELCQESTEYENAIRMDLGRTFPSHPYFSTVEGRGGQEALANMLHAYAVSDKDIGYCQGLSFVAGMILMHTKDEESAYKLLCHLMHVYGYRDVYSPDLSVLQLRLYQLSRLLHDVLPTLHSHLGSYDITPFYYAAPWFLTLFSSQYPIAFVARVMDLFFLEGPDIVFKVAVALLRFYETRILRCTTMESISEFLKERMPQLVLNHMITILNDALHMDLESKLQSFETEYFVLEELTTSFSVESEVQDLKSLNESFRSHNKELIEQLAFCRGMISNLEATVTILQETVRQQQLRLDRLEGGQPSPSLSTPPADESTAALS